jgi:hypothetical protein
MFWAIGEISWIYIFRQPITKYSYGFAAINYTNAVDGDKLLKTFDYCLIKGKPCRILLTERYPILYKTSRNGALKKLFALFSQPRDTPHSLSFIEPQRRIQPEEDKENSMSRKKTLRIDIPPLHLPNNDIDFPSLGLLSLKTARFLGPQRIRYPPGVLPPNPALNRNPKSKGRRYDREFLLQFQDVFKVKPSLDWDTQPKPLLDWDIRLKKIMAVAK